MTIRKENGKIILDGENVTILVPKYRTVQDYLAIVIRLGKVDVIENFNFKHKD